MLIYTPDSPSESLSSSKRALFLDRDGVINIDINYTHKIEGFDFIDGIFALCRAAIKHNYRIIVVTNQSGIARAYYSEADFAKLTSWMMREFAKRDIEISSVYACPHLINADLERYRRDCHARKPNPGMLLQAQKDFNLDMSECIFIGDKTSDMEAGISAGIGNLIFFNASASLHKDLDYKLSVVSSLAQAREKLFSGKTGTLNIP